jgi:small-conductance mechanosensitive channel
VETGTARTPKPSPKAVENLKHVDEVKQALEDVQSKEQPPPEESAIRARAWWLGGILFVIVLGLVASRMTGEYGSAKYWVERTILALGAVVLLVVVEQVVEVWALHRVKDSASRFNLKRVLRLVAAVLLVAALIKLLIVNWATMFASLGLASLILGFALQTPITSFIGWIYVLVRKPYRVGDRIRIGQAQGDVIDVSYLDTTLWEFGGEFLSTDHPSGRIIKFPNSNVLNTPVYNYSWPLFPYIWSEIKLDVAYQSDLEFVSGVLRDVAMEHLGQAMVKRVATYRQLLAETPVDALTVNERPNVQFRTSDNTWIEVILRYLVEPKEAGRVKTAILKKALDRLNAEPERVMFPKSNTR